jgi:hypothetical protein
LASGAPPDNDRSRTISTLVACGRRSAPRRDVVATEVQLARRVASHRIDADAARC